MKSSAASMVDATMTSENFQSDAPSIGRIIWREIYKDKIAFTALVIFCAIIITTFVWSGLMDEAAMTRVHLPSRNQPPGEQFMWGTDDRGADMVGMLVFGARNTILVGFSVTIIASTFGILLGLISGFFAGHTDNIIMRIVDTVLMLPTLMIIIVFVTLRRDYSPVDFVLIMSLFSWMGTCRLIRAMSLQQRNLDYVSASKTLGTRNIMIMFREVLPNLIPIISVNLTLGLAGNMGLETSLTFLGFGLPFGTPSLGYLIGLARQPSVMQFRMWQWLPAALLVFVLMLCIYCVGQAVRRASDVRTRRD